MTERSGDEEAPRRHRIRSDERGLVIRLRRGDEASFVEVVRRLTPSMIRVARLYCPPAVAEEVVQDTWLAVVNGLDTFGGRSSLRTWIFGILVNIARTKGLRERRQIPYSIYAEMGAEAGEPPIDPDRFRPPGDAWAGHWMSYPSRWEELPEDRLLSREAIADIGAVIQGLPPSQRDVVVLRDVLGWPSSEVSASLGISQGNQRVLLHRGRSRVRRSLEESRALDALTTGGSAGAAGTR